MVEDNTPTVAGVDDAAGTTVVGGHGHGGLAIEESDAETVVGTSTGTSRLGHYGRSTQPGQVDDARHSQLFRRGLLRRVLELPRAVLFAWSAAVIVAAFLIGRLLSVEPSSATNTRRGGALPAHQDSPHQTNQELVSSLLRDGKAAMARREYGAAVTRFFDQALLVDPEHAEALELKARAEEAMRRELAGQREKALVTTTPTVEGGGETTPGPVSSSPPATARPPAPTCRLSTEAGQTSAMVRRRATSAQARFDEGRIALENERFSAALASFETLRRDEVTCEGLDDLVARATVGLRAEAQEALKAGAAAEQRGDLAVAMQSYSRARDTDQNLPGLDAAFERLRNRMAAEGADAFKRARQYDSLGRLPEAIALYTRATEYLPEGHPDKQAARARLTTLRGGIR